MGDEKNRPLQAEEMLERIFYFMSQLVDEKGFSSTIVLLTELGRTLANSDRASFWYWDKKQKQYWTLAALGSQRIVVPEGKGIVGASITNNETIVINHPYEDARFNPEVDLETGYVTKSILCMPVANARGQVIGAYQAINKIGENGESAFDEQDVKRLTMAVVFCGKTLESHILYRESQEDALTGLKNRRGFYEYFSDFVRPKLKSEAASAIICDIDFFKKVNDTYGHNAGDAVLVHVSGILKDSMEKAGGVVVRWGGEEFVMLLTGYSESRAAACAEDIRRRVEESVCEFEDTDIKVTMSFGVRELDGDLTVDQNIEGADARLYQAKTGGRNQVVAGNI